MTSPTFLEKRNEPLLSPVPLLHKPVREPPTIPAALLAPHGNRLFDYGTTNNVLAPNVDAENSLAKRAVY
jgi:hypothetical protein